MREIPKLRKPDDHHFVLVHGVGHGAWCWYKIQYLMEASGYKVTSLDLKGSGIDKTDPNTISTLEEYNNPLTMFFSRLPENEKVILVGHSAGGLSLTDAIYKFANKIHVAVYVAANMLRYGFATDQDFKDGDPDISEYGDISELEYMLGPDKPPTSVIIEQQFQRNILYHMSPMEDSTLASILLRPGPIRAFTFARFVGGPEADSVPRVYIKTMQDHCLKPQQQAAMISRWPPSQIFELDSDHSPFFSKPHELFSFLVNLFV
ncbi:Methylesterase 17 [Quillaja saponaria]|uniref:Methylesterase 17 n=1 Tax=Quillaja saponaria TaxID=32244 RepID=A0AAD7LL28_QUISA|nr:Methylesterase 17 [Quillaja saponaria]KAJ7959953.1 Methylesterase 17 [Quillaja saponaria]